MKMDKNNKVNNLIQSLIESFKGYDHNIKNRLKIDSIFLGFEENANKNFNKLINLSDSRYKYVKFGVKLDNILSRQKSKYKNLNDGIKNDKIYSTNILDSEKSKLLKNVVTVKNKEIVDIRDKLINTLRSTDNILHRKNKLKSIIKKNKKSSFRKKKSLKIKISNNNSFQYPCERKLSNATNGNIFSRRSTIKKNTNKKSEGEKLIDNIMKEDYHNFFDKINSYHNFLDKLKNISDEYYKGKGLKINKDNFDHILSSINPNSLQFLTYNDKYQPSIVNNNTIKKDLEFDLKKIQKLKINHDKNNNSMLKTKLSKSCRTEYHPVKNPNNKDPKKKSVAFDSLSNSSNSKCIESYKDIFNSNLLGSNNKKHKTIDTIRNYNYKNTANIVYNEIEQGLFYGQNFNNKRQEFNNYFNKCFFKGNKKLENNIKNIKKSNRNLNIGNNDFLKNQKEYICEIKEYTQKRRDNIRKEFQNIYNQKKLEWKKEEKLNELKKIKENQKRKEIDSFLLNMQNKSLFKKDKQKNA